MEPYINNGVSDITYMSELIPPSCFREKAGGINSHLRIAKTKKIDPAPFYYEAILVQ